MSREILKPLAFFTAVMIGTGAANSAYAKDIQLETKTVWYTGQNQTDNGSGISRNAVNWELLKTIEIRKPREMRPDIITLESGVVVAFSEEKPENKSIIDKIEKKFKSGYFVYVDSGNFFTSKLEKGLEITYFNKSICAVSDEGKITSRFNIKTKKFEKPLKSESVEVLKQEISVKK